MENSRFKSSLYIVLFLIMLCSRQLCSQRTTNMPYTLPDSLCYKIDGFDEYLEIVKVIYTPEEIESYENREENFFRDMMLKSFNQYCTVELTGKYLNDINRQIQVEEGWTCPSEWDNICEKQLWFDIYDGWEACSIRYRGDRRKGNTSVTAIPIYYEHKIKERRKIKSFVVKIKAEGNYKIFKPEGAEVSIDYFDIDILKLDISDEEYNEHKVNCNYHGSIPNKIERSTTSKPEALAEGSIIKEFISTKCSYDLYYIDTTKGVVDCKFMEFYGTVTPNDPITITTEAGKSCLIRVNNPCKGYYAEYNIIAKKNSTYTDKRQVLLNKANCN